MSAAPTPKELVKAVSSFVQTPFLPLPTDLIELIDAFLYKRGDKWDESIADKVHDELLSLFKQDIAPKPTSYAAFIAVLRRLRPLIGQPAKVLQWFELLLPALAHSSLDATLSSQSQGIVLDILTADDVSDTDSLAGGAATLVAEKIILLWFRAVELFHRGPDAPQEFRERHLKETLLLYGKKRPKDFMAVIDQFVCKRSHRASALLLLSSFVQSRPPHLYVILQTPLFNNLLLCLQRDTSTTIISLALTVLIMILPHVPSSLVSYLPTLFNIYARLLFWRRELSINEAEQVEERRLSSTALNWEVFQFSSGNDDTTISQLLDYFTILYGLYPINFMDYIRKPQRYLRHAEAPDADVIEVQPSEIRHASEHFRQCHVLHENFYTLTIDSEKTDFGRWIKSEPAEVLADCMALRQLPGDLLNTAPTDLARIPNANEDEPELGKLEPALLSLTPNLGMSDLSDFYPRTGSPASQVESSAQVSPMATRHPSQSSRHSKRDSSSTRCSENESENSSLSRQLTISSSQTQHQDVNKEAKLSLHQSTTDDSGSYLPLGPRESMPEKSLSRMRFGHPGSDLWLPEATADEKQKKMMRYVYLLYNDLIFERFLKQQHLAHIGEFKRRHVIQATSEAETQNIFNTNKHLRQRLEEAKKAEMQAKNEAEKSRALATKWEADIFNKLKALREEKRKWNTEGSTLRVELKAAKEEADELRNLVCEVEVRELKLKQNIESAGTNFDELERLRSEVTRLTGSERRSQAKEAERQAAITRAAEADGRARMANLELAAREVEIKQTHDRYKSQIAELNSRLQDALKTDGERHGERADTQLRLALEASRATQANLTTRIHTLLQKNTELEALLFEMQTEMPGQSKAISQQSADNEDDSSSNPRSPPDLKNRPSQSFSEPSGVSYGSSPYLETVGTTIPQSQPSTPLGSEGSSNRRSLSPTTERRSSRGGADNARKDKNEKKEEREKKKPTGLRGIRGFV
ncbi:hypothetical protein F4861DRAFT_371552 [Xylaria intraflava]|nr:hypothetical protein F4861DRAFT_371552 [Xylaria intraflava]